MKNLPPLTNIRRIGAALWVCIFAPILLLLFMVVFYPHHVRYLVWDTVTVTVFLTFICWEICGFLLLLSKLSLTRTKPKEVAAKTIFLLLFVLPGIVLLVTGPILKIRGLYDYIHRMDRE